MNVALQPRETKAYQKFRRSSFLVEVYLQQKNKANWIRLGDDNTSYFYSVTKHRKLKQAITQLKNVDGNWQTDPDILATMFVDFFEDLLGKCPSM